MCVLEGTIVFIGSSTYHVPGPSTTMTVTHSPMVFE